MNLQELLAEAGYVAVLQRQARTAFGRALLVKFVRAKRAEACMEDLAGRAPAFDFELSSNVIRALCAEGVEGLPVVEPDDDEPFVFIPSPFEEAP